MTESTAFSPAALQTAVHAALSTWGRTAAEPDAALLGLRLVRQRLTSSGDTAGGGQPPSPRHAVDGLLLDGLRDLAAQDARAARVLTARFVDGKITRQVAQELHASPDQVNRWQRVALEQLSRLLYEQETAARESLVQAQMSSLPAAPYDRFFGFQALREALVAQLTQHAPPWIIAVTGIGGIGKTSLADVTVRDVIPALTYERVFWLRVENQPLSGAVHPPHEAYDLLLAALADSLWPDQARGDVSDRPGGPLRQALQARPTLVVVDNLETAAHTDTFARRLSALTDPARFLLTSRSRPAGLTAVYTHVLPELAPAEAATLLRHHAASIGLAELAEAEPEVLHTIYEAVGGNPLALKLVASLAAVQPLPQILVDLDRGAAGPIEEMYGHVYRRAWQALSPGAQQLLQAMPLVAGGGARPEQMRAISGLDEDGLWTAVRELTARSLLEVQGTLLERRYGIHHLTETFLRREIIGWPES